jgi:cob(I)alamin adenosyltransferase
MKIYTKTGDNGETSLFGGRRVHKDSPRIKAYGAVDELNAILGVCVSMIDGGPPANLPVGAPRKISLAPHSKLSSTLINLQHTLFIAGADLAAPNEIKTERIQKSHITEIEKLIDLHEAALPPLKNFIISGGAPAAAWLHLARTVCRRAESETSALQKKEKINSNLLPFLNRLSDLFFVLARHANKSAGGAEVKWEKTLIKHH